VPDDVQAEGSFAGFGVPSAPAFEDDAIEDVAALRLLLFGVNGRVFACEIAEVREIIPFRRITRLPGSPAYVLGLVNLRGSVVTVLDLGARLGGAPVDQTGGSIVLTEAGSKVVGLAVSDVRDVLPVALDAIEAPRESDEGGVVRGITHVQVSSDTGTEHSAAVAEGAAREGAPARDDEGSVVVLLDVQAIIKQALL
jgi:purine-binding chemotaxis protein CheW